ncbi:MAG TPA: hypothetical protein VGN42_02955 [Pirellulales bacterium]|jgi:trans-aconitate methyltransferase|nr:hypothetical protein [Pirellulales bacterium]
MDEQWPPIPRLLDLLDVPPEGRVLDYAAGTGRYGLALASARPDALIVVCEKDPEMMNAVMDAAAEQRFENLVVGDTPAGPPADRGLAVNVLAQVSDLELVNLRKAVVPEGFVLFVDELGTYDTAAERLQRLGYTQLDRLDTPEFPGNFVVRAR